MERPLRQHRVGELEEMFANGKGNAKLLKELESELQYRQVPRAVALLAVVQAARYGANNTSGPVLRTQLARAPTSIEAQADMWPRPPPVPAVFPPAAIPVPPNPVPPLHITAITSPRHLPLAASIVPPEFAYKILKVTPVSTWDAIEKSRQQLVLQSHPARTRLFGPEERAKTLAEAKRTNGAYLCLSQLRCGGQ